MLRSGISGRTRARTQIPARSRRRATPATQRHRPPTVLPTRPTRFAAFLSLPDAIVLVDEAGNIVWGNRSAERMFGRTLDDWAGQSGLDLVHPDDQEFVLRSLGTIQEKEVGTPIEIRINATSGWRLIEMVGSTTQWFGRDVVLLSIRDLTERRRFEVASGHEAQFRSLVHNAGSVIMLVSEDGVLQSVSSVITRLLGHDPEQLEGLPLAGIVAHTTVLSSRRRWRRHGAGPRPPLRSRYGWG